jgi:replicative DNA helicase
MNEKQLPHSIEAETGVLGSVMIDSKLFDSVARLKPESFFVRANRMLWEAIVKLMESGTPVDTITIANHLTEEGKLEEVGGVYYISKLSISYPSLSEINHLVEILEEKRKLRELIELSANLSEKAYRNSNSSEIIQESEIKLFNLQMIKRDSNQMLPACIELEEEIERIKSGTVTKGLETGIESYDKPHGGLQNSQVYGVGARPGCGKTALAIQSCVNIAMRDIPAGMISIEMDARRILGRGAAYLANVSYTDFVRRRLTADHVARFEKAKEILKRKPWVILCPTEPNGTTLRSLIREHKRTHDIQFVAVDYIQLVEVGRGEDERTAIARASNQLRLAAKECKIPVMILSQLNRESEKEARPKLYHLKNSGQIEQDCDSVTLLWSEKDHTDLKPGEMLPTIFSIEKNRDGEKGDQRMWFDGPRMKFLPRTN